MGFQSSSNKETDLLWFDMQPVPSAATAYLALGPTLADGIYYVEALLRCRHRGQKPTGTLTFIAKALAATGTVTAVAGASLLPAVAATGSLDFAGQTIAVAQPVSALYTFVSGDKYALLSADKFTVTDGSGGNAGVSWDFVFDVDVSYAPGAHKSEVAITALSTATQVRDIALAALQATAAANNLRWTAAAVSTNQIRVTSTYGGALGATFATETVTDAGFTVAITNGIDGSTATLPHSNSASRVFLWTTLTLNWQTRQKDVVVLAGDTVPTKVTALVTAVTAEHTALNTTLTAVVNGGNSSKADFTNDLAGTTGNASITTTTAATIVGMSGGTDGETCTVPYSGSGSVLFRFVKSLSVFSNIAVDTLVVVGAGDSANTVAAAIVTATPASRFTATRVNAVVTFTNKVAGTAGNQTITDTVANVGFTETNMAGGTSGLMDGETVTLNDGVNAATVLEFDTDGVVTGGRVRVDLSGITTAVACRDAALAVVNGLATLDMLATAGAGADLALMNDHEGAAGNILITETVVDAGFTKTGMAGGNVTDLYSVAHRIAAAFSVTSGVIAQIEADGLSGTRKLHNPIPSTTPTTAWLEKGATGARVRVGFTGVDDETIEVNADVYAWRVI